MMSHSYASISSMQKISKKYLHVALASLLIIGLLVGIQYVYSLLFGKKQDMTADTNNALVSMSQIQSSANSLATPDIYLNPQYLLDIAPARNQITFDIWNGIRFNPLYASKTGVDIDPNQLPDEDWYGHDEISGGIETWFTLRLSSTSPLYFVRYDAGPSGDPTYQYYVEGQTKNGDRQYIYKGTTPIGLLVPGNGILYTDSRSNEFFPAKRSFKVGPEGRLIEIKREMTLIDTKTTVQSKGVYVSIPESLSTIELTLGEQIYVKGIDEERGVYSIQIQREGVQREGFISRDKINDTEQCLVDDSTSEIFSLKTTFKHLCFFGD
jgi:hypothetical protein